MSETKTVGDKVFITQQWLYTGQTEGVASKTVERFTVLDENGDMTDETRCFKKPKGSYLVPGYVYDATIEQLPENRISLIGSPAFRHVYPNQEVVDRLRAESSARAQLIRSEAQAKKAAGEWFDTWDRLVTAYKNLSSFGDQLGFEAAVIARMRKDARRK